MIPDFKKLILDILFPHFCINCEREGELLCQDCFFLIEILENLYCPYCSKKVIEKCERCKRKTNNLSGLYCSASYDNIIIKKMIRSFKYSPFIKELAKPLSSLIIIHLLKSDNLKKLLSKNPVIIPIPLHNSKLKQRGFNQAEEIAKEIAKETKLPILKNTLIKIKKNLPQAELDKEKRLNNVKDCFFCKKPELVKNKEILLIDDIFTTGATMKECAKILKESGAENVWGMVVARG